MAKANFDPEIRQAMTPEDVGSSNSPPPKGKSAPSSKRVPPATHSPPPQSDPVSHAAAIAHAILAHGSR